jgi:hypothetical protein
MSDTLPPTSPGDGPDADRQTDSAHESDGHGSRPPRPGSMIRVRWSALVGGVAVLLLGIWLVWAGLPRLLQRTEPNPNAPASAGAGAASTRRIQATLFYVSEDGLRLVPVTRDVVYGATPAEQARRIVEAQVQTPDGLLSAIPAGTTVRSVFLTEAHEAYVDLGGTIRTGHTGGSLDEALAVYAIVNAVTTNMPDVTGVQILIDGQEVDTLAGHIDLRFPLARAADWIHKDGLHDDSN